MKRGVGNCVVRNFPHLVLIPLPQQKKIFCKTQRMDSDLIAPSRKSLQLLQIVPIHADALVHHDKSVRVMFADNAL